MFENYDTQLTIAEYKINDLRKRAQMDQKAALLRKTGTSKRGGLNFHWAGLSHRNDSKPASESN